MEHDKNNINLEQRCELKIHLDKLLKDKHYIGMDSVLPQCYRCKGYDKRYDYYCPKVEL